MVQRTLAISKENVLVLVAAKSLCTDKHNGSDTVTHTENQSAIYRNIYSNLKGVIK